jgi:hypothetical protein
MYKRAITIDARRIRRRLIRAVATVTSVCAVGLGAAAVTASPASAWLFDRCPERETSTPFAAWGDDNSYFVAPGGTFESEATDWTLSGASIVADNESHYVNSPSDTRSLSLTGDARATSPSTCVDLGQHTIRLFVKSSGDSDSVLHIEASVADPLTGLVLTTRSDIHGGTETSDWSPTDVIVIPNLLGGLLDTAQLSLVFSTSGPPATWNVDDVYVDPFKSH